MAIKSRLSFTKYKLQVTKPILTLHVKESINRYIFLFEVIISRGLPDIIRLTHFKNKFSVYICII